MDEPRRALCTYILTGPNAAAARTGEAVAEMGDEGVTVGPVSIEFLDADVLNPADWQISLGLYPEGSLQLTKLARRFETFRDAMRSAWGRARLAGLLAHGIDRPVEFRGAIYEPDREATLLVYPTHLAVMPDNEDPFQIPFGAVSGIRRDDQGWRVELETAERVFAFGMLARQTDAFAREASRAWNEGRKLFASVAGSQKFADGIAVREKDLPEFSRLLEAWSAPERLETAKHLRAKSDEVRIGLVQLLDPEGESVSAPEPLPENMAAFLLATRGKLVALEILSGPSAATYVFEGDIAAINRDLQSLHFRRRPLSFSEKELQSQAARPYRLAFRRLEPLKRLRAATRARVIHSEGWAASVEKVF